MFISFINQEIGSDFRALYIEAESFFKRAEKKNCTIVLSQLFFDEIEKRCFLDKEKIIEKLKEFGLKIEISELKNEISIRKFLVKGIHSSDAVHSAIAIKEKCDCLVTFNIKDFEKILDKITVLLPSDFY